MKELNALESRLVRQLLRSERRTNLARRFAAPFALLGGLVMAGFGAVHVIEVQGSGGASLSFETPGLHLFLRGMFMILGYLIWEAYLRERVQLTRIVRKLQGSPPA